MESRVFVVGGGFAGAMTALHLLRNTDCRVELAEPRSTLGLGVSFSAPSSEMVLNVPAASMGAFASDPEEFDRFRENRDNNFPAVDELYASRTDYGSYLTETIAAELLNHPRFILHKESVLDVKVENQGIFTVELSSGTYDAHAVVLACGSLPTRSHFSESRRYIADPWANTKWLNHDAQQVLIVGTGLTAVDVATHFLRRGSNVLMLSRHGLLPLSRSKAKATTLELPNFLGIGLKAVVKDIRRLVTQVPNWQSVIDGLRPFSNELWSSFSEYEKQQFVRHVASYWSVHRHRIPDSIANYLEKCIGEGRLIVKAAKVLEMSEADKLSVRFRSRGEISETTLEVDLCVSCFGPAHSPSKADSPLFQSLLRKNLIQPHACGVGLRIDKGFRVHSKARLYTLGHWIRGERWESNAVPDLRGDAEELAKQIACEL